MIWKMLSRDVNKSDLNVADHFSDTPEHTFWSKWFGGIVVPLIVGLYGLTCCLLHEAVFAGKNASIDLSGKTAVVFGFALISGAWFLHFHYFWPVLKRLCVFADFGKTLSLLGFIGTFGYVMWTIVVG
jgi:hypothetical protein